MVVQTRSITRKIAAQQHNAHSPLFSLPPELRLRIYEFALLIDRPLFFFRPFWYYAKPTAGGEDSDTPEDIEMMQDLQPPLSQTCSQIRVECLPVFDQTNVFYLNDVKGGEEMDVNLVLKHVLRMKKIKITACNHQGVFFCLSLGKRVEVHRHRGTNAALYDEHKKLGEFCNTQCEHLVKAQLQMGEFKKKHPKETALTAKLLYEMMWSIPKMREVLS